MLNQKVRRILINMVYQMMFQLLERSLKNVLGLVQNRALITSVTLTRPFSDSLDWEKSPVELNVDRKLSYDHSSKSSEKIAIRTECSTAENEFH